MKKVIDLNKTVHELFKENPEIIEILKEVGFDQIANSNMINTVGKFMTVKKGASMKGINLEKIKTFLIEKGYEIRE
ncbi:DUF1858 domain-containing protein [Tissierella sp. MSJ-40]|uniref:DUF1858 domain-containing protein n=1 Tax=Tissierella simiarum TaxID=2841534 RepID=A0ABS6E800_9FIRM|nr:DUF1858 domain-containing protein [Tissierella simiarum]MBU5438971.1 DUF1858 domain-containing protein [Tissierella simiarum]